MKTITLQETRKNNAPFEREPRYNVLFRGKIFCELYYNMTGYVGYLPSPKEDGTPVHLTIGERGISAYKKEIAILNKEWARYNQTSP